MTSMTQKGTRTRLSHILSCILVGRRSLRCESIVVSSGLSQEATVILPISLADMVWKCESERLVEELLERKEIAYQCL